MTTALASLLRLVGIRDNTEQSVVFILEQCRRYATPAHYQKLQRLNQRFVGTFGFRLLLRELSDVQLRKHGLAKCDTVLTETVCRTIPDRDWLLHETMMQAIAAGRIDVVHLLLDTRSLRAMKIQHTEAHLQYALMKAAKHPFALPFLNVLAAYYRKTYTETKLAEFLTTTLSLVENASRMSRYDVVRWILLESRDPDCFFRCAEAASATSIADFALEFFGIRRSSLEKTVLQEKNAFQRARQLYQETAAKRLPRSGESIQKYTQICAQLALSDEDRELLLSSPVFEQILTQKLAASEAELQQIGRKLLHDANQRQRRTARL